MTVNGIRISQTNGSMQQMVLDAGEAVEFENPSELLQREKSLFKSLVDESSDKEVLYKSIGLSV